MSLTLYVGVAGPLMVLLAMSTPRKVPIIAELQHQASGSREVRRDAISP